MDQLTVMVFDLVGRPGSASGAESGREAAEAAEVIAALSALRRHLA
jgi:hypothetical protein